MTMAPSSSSSSTSARSFVESIRSSYTLHNGKLKIPSKFVKYYGDELAECVSLSVPSGLSWNVMIQREADEAIWFHDGLLKFMGDNSIGKEFALVFEYRGGSKFSVIILDVTGIEIQYNCTNTHVNQMQNAVIREGTCDSQKAKGDDDSIVCLGSSATHLLPQRSPGPSKYALTHHLKKCFLREANNIEPRCLTGKKRKMIDRGILLDGSGGNSSTSRRECANKRTNSTTFKVTLKSYNIKKRILVVPCKFARLNMPHSSQRIKLVDPDGNQWVVRFHCTTDRYFLTMGWSRFVKNRQLMEGDVCIFERMRGNPVKLKVNIYRSADGKNSKMHKGEAKIIGCDASPRDFTVERTIEAENKLMNDFFEVTLTPSYISSYVNVPLSFAPLLAPLNSRRLIKVVDADNKEWVVRFIHKPGSHRLTQGWRRFARDKKLMVGDICIFKRVWGNEVKLKVTTSILAE